MDAAQLGLGAALVGRVLLCWWPDDGWQRGTVACLCPRCAQGLSHVVAYTWQTLVLRGKADTDPAGCFSRRPLPRLLLWPLARAVLPLVPRHRV